MNEETQKLLEEVRKGVTADLQPQVEALVKSLIPDRKDVFGADSDAKAKQEAKQKSADFVKAVFAKDLAQVKALSEGSNTDGGYLVPEYFASEITRVAGLYGVARRNARVVPVSGWKTNMPTAGSVTAYRVAEKGAITSSAPSIGRVTLTLKKVATMIPVSNELLRDANVATVDLLAKLSAEAFGKYEDEWAFLGKGAGEGIFQDTDVPAYTMASTKDAYSDVTFDDLIGVMDKVNEGALSGAKWYMSFSVFNILRQLKYSAGTASYILQEPGAGQPATIWNFPVEFVSVMPKASDESQAGKPFIAFGNLDYMLIGSAGQYEMTVSQEATVTDTDGTTAINLFEQDMSAVRVIERIDIELAEADKAFAVCKTATS